MTYLVIVKKSAESELKTILPSTRRRVVEKLLALETDPRPEGSKKLVAADHVYRVRTGDYRILYNVDDRQHIVNVLKIAHRRDVYR